MSMSVWYSKNIGDAMLADGQLEHIKALFRPAYEMANRPKEMAIFIRHESEGRLHCEVMAYFSPACVEIAKAVGAIPCNKPEQDSLGLLVGSDESWSLLFR